MYNVNVLSVELHVFIFINILKKCQNNARNACALTIYGHYLLWAFN